jgi:putative phosphoesterase
MKIAIISDIHGNSVALNSVIKIINNKKIDRIYVLGDIVGYYYDSDIILDILHKYNAICIQGNHELILQKIIHKEITISSITKKYGSGMLFSIKKLSSKQIKDLIDLPKIRCENIDGKNIVFCHGSPDCSEEYLYPDTKQDTFKKYAYSDIVFCGHTHIQYMKKVDGTLFVGVGSVGQNRIQGGVANWVIFDTDTESVTTMATPFDIRKIAEEVAKIDGKDSYLYKVLFR